MMLTKIVDGVKVALPPHEEAALVAMWQEAANDQAQPQPQSDAVSLPPRLVAAAMAIDIAGGEVVVLNGSFNVAATVALGAGQFMLLFYNSLPNDDYYVVAQGDLVTCKTIEATADYFVLETRNGSGDLTDPSRLCVQVYKVG
jgi:hypothetical protein